MERGARKMDGWFYCSGVDAQLLAEVRQTELALKTYKEELDDFLKGDG